MTFYLHGAGLSIVTPGWMDYAAARDPKKFAQLAREVFAIGKADEREAALEGIPESESLVFRHRQSDLFEGTPYSCRRYRKNHGKCLYVGPGLAVKDYTREVISDILKRCRKKNN